MKYKYGLCPPECGTMSTRMWDCVYQNVGLCPMYSWQNVDSCTKSIAAVVDIDTLHSLSTIFRAVYSGTSKFLEIW